MKKYIGKKEVLAEPMDEMTAVKLGLARENKDNHEWRNGYKVVYKDGYESWSPSEAFNEAYKSCDDFVDRLRIELEELQDKQHKLDLFFNTEKFKSLPVNKRNLMEAQFGAMLAYSSVLIERLRLESES